MADQITDADRLEIDSVVNGVLRGIAGGNQSKPKKSFTSLTEGVTSVQSSGQGGVPSRRRTGNRIEEEQAHSSLYDPTTAAAPPLTSVRKPFEKVYGKGLLNIKPLEMDEQLRRDVKVIQMRNYMDPKRFYKNPDKMGAILHVGTVIEGAAEFKSHRLTRRERKQSLLEEVMADGAIKGYTKQRYGAIQERSARPKGKKGKPKAFKVHKKGVGKR